MKRFVQFTNALLIITLLVSCAKDQDLIPLDKEQALELIASSSQLSEQTFQEFYLTEGFNSFSYFQSLLKETELYSKGEGSSQVVNLYPFLVRRFIYPYSFVNELDTPYGNYGTYTWDANIESWDFSDDPSNQVLYLFPSMELSGENDANLTITNYQVGVLDGESISKKFNITLRVDESLVYSTNYDATIQNDRIDKVSISINLSPFTSHTDIYTKYISGDELIAVTFSLKKSATALMSSKLEFLFEDFNHYSLSVSPMNNDFSNLKAVQGFFQIGSLKYTIDVVAKKFEEGSTPSQIQASANSYFKVNLYAYPTGELVAKLVWTYSVEDDQLIPFFEFSNGSQEPAYEYLPELVRDFLDDLFNH